MKCRRSKTCCQECISGNSWAQTIYSSLPSNPSILLSCLHVVIIADFSFLCFFFFIRLCFPYISHVNSFVVRPSFLGSHVTLSSILGVIFVLFSWQHSFPICFEIFLFGGVRGTVKGDGEKKRLVRLCEV